MRKLATISRSRLVRHLVQDLLLIGWVAGWVRVGFWMHDLVAVLRQPADRLGSVGAGLDRQLGAAASAATDLPLVGDRLGAPFEAMRGPTRELQATAGQLSEQVEHLATVLAWVSAAVPILVVVAIWVWRARASGGWPASQRPWSTPTRTSTCSPSGLWCTNRCTAWPGSAPTPPAPGAAVSRPCCASSPSSSSTPLD